MKPEVSKDFRFFFWPAIMRDCMLRLLLLATAAQLPAQRIVYSPLTPDAITYRLRQAALIEEKNNDRNNALRREKLRGLFDAAGCKDHSRDGDSRGKRNLANLICVLPGESDSQIVVGGHFDKTPTSGGIVDNWSGSSLLPSLYESLIKSPRKHTYVFIAFADEEKGLLGSKHYVKRMTKDEIARTRAMINLDTLGLGDTKVWVSHADKRLVELLVRVAGSMKLPLSAYNVEYVGGSTDSESFRERKMPALTFHSLAGDGMRVLHSPRDRFEAVNLEAYYDSYKMIAVYLAYLDITLE